MVDLLVDPRGLPDRELQSGPVGTPITVEVNGIGWRPLENSWTLLYDNNFTGWISAVTTAGSARFTIPATGRPGVHVIEVMHGEFTFPYRNMQQSPEADRPRFVLHFIVTPGASVLPPPIAEQAQQSVDRLPAPGALTVTPRFAAVGEKVTVSAAGYTPGERYALDWTTVIGNRVGGHGWNEASRPVAEAAADASGRLGFDFAAPDDLGGAHALTVENAPDRQTGSLWIKPTALPLDVERGPVATPFTLHLKGLAGQRLRTSTPWSTTTAMSDMLAPSTARGMSGFRCRRPAIRVGILSTFIRRSTAATSSGHGTF